MILSWLCGHWQRLKPSALLLKCWRSMAARSGRAVWLSSVQLVMLHDSCWIDIISPTGNHSFHVLPLVNLMEKIIQLSQKPLRDSGKQQFSEALPMAYGTTNALFSRHCLNKAVNCSLEISWQYVVQCFFGQINKSRIITLQDLDCDVWSKLRYLSHSVLGHVWTCGIANQACCFV